MCSYASCRARPGVQLDHPTHPALPTWPNTLYLHHPNRDSRCFRLLYKEYGRWLGTLSRGSSPTQKGGVLGNIFALTPELRKAVVKPCKRIDAVTLFQETAQLALSLVPMQRPSNIARGFY